MFYFPLTMCYILNFIIPLPLENTKKETIIHNTVYILYLMSTWSLYLNKILDVCKPVYNFRRILKKSTNDIAKN